MKTRKRLQNNKKQPPEPSASHGWGFILKNEAPGWLIPQGFVCPAAARAQGSADAASGPERWSHALLAMRNCEDWILTSWRLKFLLYIVLVLSAWSTVMYSKRWEEQGPLKERCLHPKAGPGAPAQGCKAPFGIPENSIFSPRGREHQVPWCIWRKKE